MAATAGRSARPVGRVGIALVALAVALGGAGAGAARAGADGGRPEPVSERIERLAVDIGALGRGVARGGADLPQGTVPAAPAVAGDHADDPIDMKVLVITAGKAETDFPAITLTLDRLGIPYDVFDAVEADLTPDRLWDGGVHGYYQAVILATGHLWHPSGAALTWDEWLTLWDYEARFGVRQVTSQTFPDVTYGFDYVGYIDTLYADPVVTTMTPEGQEVFSYLQPGATVEFDNAWVYLGTIDADPTSTTTPLLVSSDGYPIVSVTTFADGRENLAVTAANAPHLLQTTLLSYGIVNWATRGLFLGERHVNLDVQVDDLLIDSDEWPRQDSDTTGPTYRLTADDLAALKAWQEHVRATYPGLEGFTLELAYNGEGAMGIYPNDDLTPAVIASEQAFNWVNHGYEHLDLNTASFWRAYMEIVRNRTVDQWRLGLTKNARDSFVQPDISGLENRAFFLAAALSGVRYAISDTSRSGWWTASSPNTGVYDPYGYGVLVLPRRPTNLFYNVTTPAEFVDAYNHYYAPGGVWPYWDHALTYDEILDVESDFLLSYLVTWEVYPWMFHQANLRAYDGEHSVLGDLLEAAFAKYTALYRLPVRNLTQHDVGGLVRDRMAYNEAGVTASVMPCGTASPSITIRTQRRVTVPVTGVAHGSRVETYGSQPISYVTVSRWAPVTIPLSCPTS